MTFDDISEDWSQVDGCELWVRREKTELRITDEPCDGVDYRYIIISFDEFEKLGILLLSMSNSDDES